MSVIVIKSKVTCIANIKMWLQGIRHIRVLCYLDETCHYFCSSENEMIFRWHREAVSQEPSKPLSIAEDQAEIRLLQPQQSIPCYFV